MKTIDAIVAKADRRDAWYDDTRIVKRLPDSVDLDFSHYPGTYSIAGKSKKVRYVLKACSIILPGGLVETPTKIARDYIDVLDLRAPKIRTYSQETRIARAIFGKAFMPTFSQVREFDDGSYIDIRRAWFSIALAVGWNCNYSPGQFLFGGYRPVDFPFADSRDARNALFTLYRPKRRQDDKGIKFVTTTGETKYFPKKPGETNAQINALLNDVLHSIAADAIDCGAVYCATDGYIAPNQNATDRIAQMIRDWGLPYSIKDNGRGGIDGARAYWIGDKKTARDGSGRDCDYVGRIHSRRWLQDRFAYLVAGANAQEKRAPIVKERNPVDDSIDQ